MSGADSSDGCNIRHESQGWGFEFLSSRDIFGFDTSTTTSVSKLKMNAAARAQLIFQNLTLIKIYLYTSLRL